MADVLSEFRNAKKDDNIYFGRYPHNADGLDATPVEWRVLKNDNGKLFLISERVLAFAKHTEVSKFLNDEFYNIAFSDSEKTAIVPQNGFNVNLLSIKDVENVELFGADSKISGKTIYNFNEKRLARETAYAIAKAGRSLTAAEQNLRHIVTWGNSWLERKEKETFVTLKSLDCAPWWLNEGGQSKSPTWHCGYYEPAAYYVKKTGGFENISPGDETNIEDVKCRLGIRPVVVFDLNAQTAGLDLQLKELARIGKEAKLILEEAFVKRREEFSKVLNEAFERVGLAKLESEDKQLRMKKAAALTGLVNRTNAVEGEQWQFGNYLQNKNNTPIYWKVANETTFEKDGYLLLESTAVLSIEPPLENFLENEFFNKAFSEEQKLKILPQDNRKVGHHMRFKGENGIEYVCPQIKVKL
jgi:hypothetical protein